MTITVMNTDDSGARSLREAINTATTTVTNVIDSVTNGDMIKLTTCSFKNEVKKISEQVFV